MDVRVSENHLLYHEELGHLRINLTAGASRA